jgi:hypothetical protein
MRLTRVHVALILSAFFAVSILAQQTSTSATQPTQRDAQALTILSQVVNAAGGLQVLSAIQDFTASGTVIYNWADSPVQGNVTLKGRGLGQFRLDSALPDGTRTWLVNSGTATQKSADGTISPLPFPFTFKPSAAFLPLALLVAALQDNSWNISYVGIVTTEGKEFQDIRLQKVFAGESDPSGFKSRATQTDFLIDPTTYLITGVQDRAYRNDGDPGESPHEMKFANYQRVNGIAVPFSITELISGQQTVAVQLTQVAFNSGLTDSDFMLP